MRYRPRLASWLRQAMHIRCGTCFGRGPLRRRAGGGDEGAALRGVTTLEGDEGDRRGAFSSCSSPPSGRALAAAAPLSAAPPRDAAGTPTTLYTPSATAATATGSSSRDSGSPLSKSKRWRRSRL